jgi:hypothetical protein
MDTELAAIPLVAVGDREIGRSPSCSPMGQMSAPFRNPRKSAGLKTTVLPCSLVCFLPDDWILPYAPVEPAEDAPKRGRRWQKQLELSQRARLAADLVDRIRGVCD